MAMCRRTYTTKSGEVRVYEYHYDYYVTAEERALQALKKRPLQRVRKPGGGLAYKWTAGQRGPFFHDATIVRLIEKGKARCVGEFVELVGAVRRNIGEVNGTSGEVGGA